MSNFLANVVRYNVIARPSVVCLSSVVCNVRVPYSGNWNFRGCFYAIWYLGIDIQVKFYGDRPREPLRWGVKHKRGIAKYNNFGPIERYISETVQDRS